MVTGVLAAGAAYLTLSKGISAVNDSISGLANLKDLSEKTGSSVENLSKMEKVAKQFGGDFAQVDVALSKLAKGMASVDSETNKAHKALGALNLTDFSKTHDASEVMVEVAKRLQGYADGAGKAALATDLFGKSGADLIPYLNDLAEGFDKQTGASTAAADQAEAFENKLGALKVKVGELFQNLAIDLLPTLNDIADVFIDASQASKDMAGDDSALNWADELALAGARVYDVFSNVANLIRALAGSFKVVYADIKVAAASFGNTSNGRFGGIKNSTDFNAAVEERDKLLKEVDALYKKPGDSTATYDALLTKINTRQLADFFGRGHPGRPNGDKPKLTYETGNAGADDSVKRAKDAEDKKLAIWQKAFDAKKAQDIKWFEDELELKEYYDKQLAKEKKETQEKWLELEQKNIEIAQKEREDALEKLQKKHEEVWNSIENTAHDVWTSVWQDGSNAFKNIGKTIKSAVLDLLYQITVKRWIIGISSSSVGGSISSAASSILGGGSGGGSILSSLSGIGNLFSQGNSAIVSSIESLGTFLSTGTGGLGDLLGGALGQYAGAISNVLPFAGAAFSLLTGDIKGAASQGIGAGIGLAIGGPIGGLIGSALGGALGGLFGGASLPDRIFSGQDTVLRDGKIVQSVRGPAKSSWDAGGANDALAKLNAQALSTLGAVFKEFQVGGELSAYSAVSKKKSSDAGLHIMLDGEYIGGASTGKIKKGSLQQAFDALVKDSYKAITSSIEASSLSDGVKKFFKEVSSNDGLNETVSVLVSLNSQLKDLPPVFDAIRNAIDTTSYKTSIADLSKNFAAIGTYTSLFYTAEEQFGTFTKQLTSQFDALGSVMPKSRDEFRALVDGIKVTDESSSNLFHGLVALAPAMDAFYKQIEQINGAVSRDSFASRLDAQRYAGVAANYGSTIASDYTSNLNAGRIMVGANGVATTEGGNTNLLAEVKMLRAAVEAVAVSTSKTVSELRKYYNTALPVTVVTP